MAAEARAISVTHPQEWKNSCPVQLKSELFAMGPVQFWQPRRVAEDWFAKPGSWEDSVSFSQEKQQNTEFTKCFSVRTPEFTKSDFSGLAPIRWVLMKGHLEQGPFLPVKMGILQAAFLLTGIGLFLYQRKLPRRKANLSFKSPSSKPPFNRTGSVFALPTSLPREHGLKTLTSSNKGCGAFS